VHLRRIFLYSCIHDHHQNGSVFAKDEYSPIESGNGDVNRGAFGYRDRTKDFSGWSDDWFRQWNYGTHHQHAALAKVGHKPVASDIGTFKKE